MKITSLELFATLPEPHQELHPLKSSVKREFVFLGRSNVGKSSFLNSCFERKNFAKTSSKPGKTRTINYFLVNKTFFCVDLPGYGFVKGDKKTEKTIPGVITKYFEKTHHGCIHVFLIFDVNVGITSLDKQVITFLSDSHIPFTLIANKVDKIKSSEIHMRINHFHTLFPQYLIFPYSSKQGNKYTQNIFQVFEQYKNLI